MSRRPVVAVALIAAAAVTAVPAHAATKRPKPITGTYQLTLIPDPTPNATNDSCGLLAASQDKHPFTVPAKGTLHVVLDSPNPVPDSPAGGLDWDLHIADADDAPVDSSTGATAHEETTTTFRKKQAVKIWVCNLAGETTGTVTYTFTYA